MLPVAFATAIPKRDIKNYSIEVFYSVFKFLCQTQHEINAWKRALPEKKVIILLVIYCVPTTFYITTKGTEMFLRH